MKNRSVILFLVILFFISFADAIMSYVSPIFIESRVNNTFLMGLIFSFSSAIGLICDLFFPKIFTNQPHFFFLKATLLAAVMFPLMYLIFPSHVLTLLFAMAIWGIYYELNIFSSFHFIKSYIHLSNHAKAWGLLQVVSSISYAFAPLFAVELLNFGYTSSFVLVIVLLSIAILLTLYFKHKFVKTKVDEIEEKPTVKTWLSEIHIWKLLFPRVWHLLLLQLILTVIDSGFWTVGTLLTQKLSKEHFLGSFFLTAYMAPSIFVGLLLSKKVFASGKKKITIIFSFITGLLLFTYLFIKTVPILLLVTILISITSGIAIPELRAVFEDYVARLKDKDNEMIGMHSSSSSLAYIVGPIIAASIASVYGYMQAFSIMGITLAIISFLIFFIVPKKIKMPQKELQEV